jgi:hypothetical protein
MTLSKNEIKFIENMAIGFLASHSVEGEILTTAYDDDEVKEITHEIKICKNLIEKVKRI